MAVKIYNVTKGSHAEKAGIRSGETLLKINSNEIMVPSTGDEFVKKL